MLRRLKIRTKLGLVIAVPLAAITILAAIGFTTFQAAKVEGPSYAKIIDAKDVVADVLPPPEYIIEAFLTVQQLADLPEAAERDVLIDRLVALEKDYNVRHEYWQPRSMDPALRKAFLEDSYTPAIDFWKVVNSDFLPAVNANDGAKAQSLASGRLKQLYAQHRVAVDQTVSLAIAEQTNIEAETRDLIANRSLVMFLAFAGTLALAGAVGFAVARSITRPVEQLRKAATEDLPRVIDDVKRLDPDEEMPTLQPVVIDSEDELAEAARSFNTVLQTAVDLAATQARMRHSTSEMFVNLGRRNQNLVSRQLKFIDGLEHSETDPELLASLFRLDHLATRMRRNAESLLVLAGVEPARRWKKSVVVKDVVRGAVAEVEEYSRVDIAELEAAKVMGSAVSDVSHLLAELVENAVHFSPPDTLVTVRGGFDRSGAYVLTVTDQGMGMVAKELAAANERLVNARNLDEAPSAYLGLFVVGRLAARYDVHVELQSDGGYGLTAFVVLPADLLDGVNESNNGMGAAATTNSLDRDPDAGENRGHAAEVTAANGFKKREPVAEIIDFDRFADAASPAATPRSAEDRRSRLDSFSAGKSMAGQRGADEPAAADADAVAPAIGAEPEPESVITNAGFKKRTPKGETVDFDRFAEGGTDDADDQIRTRPAAEVQSRLDSFTAGKRRAVAGTNGDAEHTNNGNGRSTTATDERNER